MNEVTIKKEGEIITLKPNKVGSISHTFRVLDGRATLVESPHNPVLKKGGISLNGAAEISEVSNLIDVLETLRDIMFSQRADEVLDEEEIKPGTWVKTCDGRYGRVKRVDWHALKFLGRKDYQVEFPDGVGIFKRDEIDEVTP